MSARLLNSCRSASWRTRCVLVPAAGEPQGSWVCSFLERSWQPWGIAVLFMTREPACGFISWLLAGIMCGEHFVYAE